MKIKLSLCKSVSRNTRSAKNNPAIATSSSKYQVLKLIVLVNSPIVGGRISRLTNCSRPSSVIKLSHEVFSSRFLVFSVISYVQRGILLIFQLRPRFLFYNIKDNYAFKSWRILSWFSLRSDELSFSDTFDTSNRKWYLKSFLIS